MKRTSVCQLNQASASQSVILIATNRTPSDYSKLFNELLLICSKLQPWFLKDSGLGLSCSTLIDLWLVPLS